MSTWYSDDTPPPQRRLGAGDWLRVLGRGIPLGFLLLGGLVLVLALRLAERPLCKARRPVTPVITTVVCRAALWVIGLDYAVSGRPARGLGAQVANHASWLDIFVLNACQQVYFVSKSEVAGWPGIGWLARATGTLFIARDPREAQIQTRLFRERTLAGHRLVFFPEGTSSDSLRVLPFKTTLFAAFFDPDLKPNCTLQPVSVVYTAPRGADPRFYGWWGHMEFGAHALQVLAAPRQGEVSVTFHPAIAVSACADRKTIARRCEAIIRSAHQAVSDKSAITSSGESPSAR